MDEPLVPGSIIGFGDGVDLVFKNFCQPFLFRCKESLAHDPPGPFPLRVKDQDAPAAIIPADLRACQVDGAVPFCLVPVEPEERTCLGAFGKYTPVPEQSILVRVNRHFRFLSGILVVDKVPVVPVILPYRMDKAKVAATFPALAAFKRHVESGTGYYHCRDLTVAEPHPHHGIVAEYFP